MLLEEKNVYFDRTNDSWFAIFEPQSKQSYRSQIFLGEEGGGRGIN